MKLEALRALRPTHVIVNVDENEAGAVEAMLFDQVVRSIKEFWFSIVTLPQGQP